MWQSYMHTKIESLSPTYIGNVKKVIFIIFIVKYKMNSLKLNLIKSCYLKKTIFEKIKDTFAVVSASSYNSHWIRIFPGKN